MEAAAEGGGADPSTVAFPRHLLGDLTNPQTLHFPTPYVVGGEGEGRTPVLPPLPAPSFPPDTARDPPPSPQPQGGGGRGAAEGGGEAGARSASRRGVWPEELAF